MTDKHATCPYRNLPESAYWRKAVAGIGMRTVNPAPPRGSFEISNSTRVATAGSCFAQNIARFLIKSGYNYMLTESVPAIGNQDIWREFNYGTFTARYGNIYTTRQLLQLFRRAYSLFEPEEPVWESEGRYIDPFRPLIQPEGFASLAELMLDRQQHLAAVRRMIEELDVFVFTLGLTEAWVSRRDGAVFPVCPGCGQGTFDEELYAFENFGMAEVEADLLAALALLREHNTRCGIIVTVSPVPLIATAGGQHVLTATTYSKSVLRVVAERVSQQVSMCDYFPAYEVITGAYGRGQYFAEDLRGVTTEGIEHVMRCFRQTYFEPQIAAAAPARAKPSARAAATPKVAPKATPASDEPPSFSAAVSDLICDEEILVP